MECQQTGWPDNENFLKDFYSRTARQRIPLSGGISLTHKCNLRCVHCYLGGNCAEHANKQGEIDTGKWKSIIDEIAEAGCMYLLITGGEPLLRKDFAEIYVHAKRKGMLVTLFSNGTLVTDDHVALLAEWPPRYVEISLYGATPQTYETITGVKGSYGRCIDGIEKLMKGNIRVKLKTVLMTLNRHELHAMEEIAERYDINFRFDAGIFPRFTGDPFPIDLRVSPEEAVATEMSNQKRIDSWSENYLNLKQAAASATMIYDCGAGMSTFHIDADGKLLPCIMTQNPSYDLKKGRFMHGWEKIIPAIRDQKTDADNVCSGCEDKNVCGYCPPSFLLETGSEERRSNYICRTGRLRTRAIEAHIEQGEKNGVS
jgi:radical SAM protein with 4Fe4S-binding SPASM domain